MKLDKLLKALGLCCAVSFLACDSREGQGTEPTDEGDCVGSCSETDGGTTPGGTIPGQQTPNPGVPAKEIALKDLRSTAKPGEYVQLTNVVISFISFERQGTQGDWLSEFWVTDEQNPQHGIWVEKYYTDLPKATQLKAGDRITVKGWFGSTAPFDDRDGRRQAIRSEGSAVKGGKRLLEITVLSAGEPPAPVTIEASTGFGDAKAGTVAANPEYTGALVHLNGKFEITNAAPPALARKNMDGTIAGYNGFEITGGILVNNIYTYRSCDVRKTAEAGTKVSFGKGVTGIWDSYTHAPCIEGSTTPATDGGTGSFKCTKNDYGAIPGTDRDYTLVLYPRSCADLAVDATAPQQ